MAAKNISPAPTRVILVGVKLKTHVFDTHLQELYLLAQTAGLTPVEKLSCKRLVPDPAFFIGSGKIQELKYLLSTHEAHEVIFDQAISATQQRNLERELKVAVYDRHLLILEIFAQRARSSAGKLQVELAKLQYLATRLVRRWTHLERQRGGINTRGGPGESQMELDKRIINTSILKTKKHLSLLQKQRHTQRRKRQRDGMPNIALVGYTNAGKSTLFNRLVKANAFAADQLFATLDTTTRYLYLSELRRKVSVSDTVGFIHNLPHALIDAFAATLQEAVKADLILHVVDRSAPNYNHQIEQVQKVLHEIHADHIEQIMVFNKQDAIQNAFYQNQKTATYWLTQHPKEKTLPIDCIYLSAITGDGMAELRSLLSKKLLQHKNHQPVTNTTSLKLIA